MTGLKGQYAVCCANQLACGLGKRHFGVSVAFYVCHALVPNCEAPIAFGAAHQRRKKLPVLHLLAFPEDGTTQNGHGVVGTAGLHVSLEGFLKTNVKSVQRFEPIATKSSCRLPNRKIEILAVVHSRIVQVGATDTHIRVKVLECPTGISCGFGARDFGEALNARQAGINGTHLVRQIRDATVTWKTGVVRFEVV
jgi:hypothetical protein